MSLTRVRVRRERPSAPAWALALAVTMLVVYLATLFGRPAEEASPAAAAPRVTRQIELGAAEIWCVSLARCASREEARLCAASAAGRGAAGVVLERGGAFHVLGAAYDKSREAERVAKRLRREAQFDAQVLALSADAASVRITAPEAHIEALAAADALLLNQIDRLGALALQLDRGEIQPDAARALFALAATESAERGKALKAIPGGSEQPLCRALIDAMDAAQDMLAALTASARDAPAQLPGLTRCVQIELFLRRLSILEGLGK